MSNTAYKDNHTLKAALRNLIKKLSPDKLKGEGQSKSSKPKDKCADLQAEK